MTSEVSTAQGDVLFCRINSPKPSKVKFTVIENKEKRQILTFEKL